MFTGIGEKTTSENIQAHCCKISDFPGPVSGVCANCFEIRNLWVSEYLLKIQRQILRYLPHGLPEAKARSSAISSKDSILQ